MHNKIDIDLEIAHLPVDLVTGIKISDKEEASIIKTLILKTCRLTFQMELLWG